jgi:periplasmic protein TonB
MTVPSKTRGRDRVIRIEDLLPGEAPRKSGNDAAALSMPWSSTRAPDNVIRLTAVRPDATARPPALVIIGVDSRPVPPSARSPRRMAALLAISLLCHVGIYALAWPDAEPLDGVSIEAISIDIVLGGETVAGVAEKPQEFEAELAPSVEQVKPQEQAVEQQQLTVQQSEQVPLAERETSPFERPIEKPLDMARDEPPKEIAAQATPQTQVAEVTPEPKPVEVQTEIEIAEVILETHSVVPMVETAEAEIPTVRPAEKPSDMEAVLMPPPTQQPEQTKEQEPEPQPAAPKELGPERARIAAPTSKEASQQSSVAAAPPPPSAGVGVGRSSADANYRALVAAHLARFKQYPAEARSARQQGTGSVTFTIDSGGRVTFASVKDSTGSASLDRELTAMVRRASPLPRPPSGGEMSFTVPINFRMPK